MPRLSRNGRAFIVAQHLCYYDSLNKIYVAMLKLLFFYFFLFRVPSAAAFAEPNKMVSPASYDPRAGRSPRLIGR